MGGGFVMMEEAKKIAKAEGVPVNQLINVAVAEKVSALCTEEYVAERAARGDIKSLCRSSNAQGQTTPRMPATNCQPQHFLGGALPDDASDA